MSCIALVVLPLWFDFGSRNYHTDVEWTNATNLGETLSHVDFL